MYYKTIVKNNVVKVYNNNHKTVTNYTSSILIQHSLNKLSFKVRQLSTILRAPLSSGQNLLSCSISFSSFLAGHGMDKIHVYTTNFDAVLSGG